MVVSSSDEAEKGAPYRGETSVRNRVAMWKRLDHATVGALVGGKV